MVTGRTFAISDIHGCARTFQKLVQEEIHLEKSDKLYLMADYIDRGPDSKGVIDYILHLQDNGHNVYTLRGNHEQLMMDSLNDAQALKLWIQNGGDATLKSFDVKSYKNLNPVYRSFFENTEFCHVHERYPIVHAGLNFENDDIFEDEHAMLWTRDMQIDMEKLGDRVVLHGHTPLALHYITSQFDHTEINIDGGCVFKKTTGFGNLVAYNLTEGKFHCVKNID